MSQKLEEYFQYFAYDSQQKEQLIDADEKHLDISKMSNPMYDWEQMREIKLCLESGIEPDPICDPDIPSEQMENIRIHLESKNSLYEEKYEDIAKRRLKRIFITSIFIAIVLITAFILFWQKDNLAQYINPLELELTKESDKVGISQIDNIDLMKYVKKYNKNYKIDYSPTSLSEIGTTTITYKISNDAKTTKRYLKIKVYDDIKPILELSTTNVTIDQGSSFNAYSYIKKATDNYDGANLHDNVKIDGNVNVSKAGNYTITYSLEDKAKNSTEVKLYVTVKEKSQQSNDVNNRNNSTNRNSSNNQSNSTRNSSSSRKTTAQSRTFNFSNSSDMNATYSKALAYAQSQLSQGKARSYDVTPVRGSDGIYTGYRVTFS